MRRYKSKPRLKVDPTRYTQLFKGVNMDNLLRHEANLYPILAGGYHSHSDAIGNKQAPFSIRHTLDVPIASVINLSMKPGQRWFLTWYYILTYFPLTAACLAPLANMVSIVALVEHWRMEMDSNKTISDSRGLMALNGLSLLFGIIGNISLLMNFSGHIRYLVTQIISICFWVMASTLLLADIIVTNRSCIGPHPVHRRTQGFWFAVWTCFFYFSCAIILTINFCGYKLEKYPPKFNLGPKQRTLMVYVIVLVAWCIVGTCIMLALIRDISYGAALYYIIVSFLTVGLGDILPQTHAAKAMVLVCSIIGVLMMGLVIAMIRQVVMLSSGPTVFWHTVEKHRVKLLNKLRAEGRHLTPEESFRDIRLIRRLARMQQLNISLAITVGIFCIFWLVGAVVFHYCEGWSYFNAVYFCFLCLITIGYGDFAPKLEFGRSFFVVWAISAVPLMTILISNVGDELFQAAGRLTDLVSRTFFTDHYLTILRHRMEHNEDTVEGNIDVDEEDNLGQVEFDYPLLTVSTQKPIARPHTEEEWAQYLKRMGRKLEKQKETYAHLLKFMERLKPLITDSIEEPLRRYDHEEWSDFLLEMDAQINLLPVDVDDPEPVKNKVEEYFWVGRVSDSSPLRLPIKEPNYMIMKVFFKIEHDLTRLVQISEDETENFQQWVASMKETGKLE